MTLSESKNIEKMTSANYPIWIEKVRDYIMALEHDDAADIWQAFVWVPGGPVDDEGDDEEDPADHDYVPGRWQRC